MNFKHYKTSILLVVVIVLFTGAAIVFGAIPESMLENELLKTFVNATGPMTSVCLFLFFYDNYLWHMRFFKHLNIAPDLRGQYEGYITYFRGGKELKKRCVLILTQTCSAIEIECVFSREGEPETRSRSNYVNLNCSRTSKYKISFSYHNEGSKIGGGTLHPHDGFNHLRVNIQDNLISLSGHYFTERRTIGKMEVVRTKPKERA